MVDLFELVAARLADADRSSRKGDRLLDTSAPAIEDVSRQGVQAARGFTRMDLQRTGSTPE
jgi:hypothetical protein